MTAKLTQLMEEEPQLSVKWDEVKGEVYIRVMGPVQLEVIQKLVESRYGIKISYGQGRISYRETIATKSLGVGHFEPLRHYAEVHLLLEPGEPGSGLVFDTIASEDVLAKNWQRLILTHLAEKEHVGVLTGSPITDIKITLTTGRAHPKHTEGGDFRQATYRAVRQGLMMAQSVLLEPVYNFKIEVPHEFAGRVLSDIVRLKGVMQSQEIEEETTIISGKAPVFTMREYYSELTALSRGRGKLWLELSGYEPCHNTDYVLEQVGYEPDMDMSNPAASVFCAHGAGYLVDWYDVHENMHVKEDPAFAIVGEVVATDEDYEKDNQRRRKSSMDMSLSQEELEEIFARTYGGVYKDKEQSRMKYRKTSSSYETNGISSGSAREKADSVPQNYKIASGALKRKNSGQEYLIVDGYNVIFCWDELKKLAEINLDSARDKLMDVLSNYQGYMNMSLTVVFDGYKVKDNPGTKYNYDNISVVYTKEGETADAYIEKLTHELGKKHKVTVVTSDRLEQIVTMGQGAIRMSSRDFKEEVDRVNRHIRDNYLGGD
jgi:predicted RNA-binding protein with PIN domain